MFPERILVSHNYYQQPGGEDEVFAAEVELLRSHGHSVLEYTEHNRDVDGMSVLRVAARSVWSETSKNRVRDLLATAKTDIAHFHNVFPLISPAAYWACSDAGVPVVQTLHNYRLLCPAATFFRDGKICKDCLGKKVTWPGVLHGCYKGSRTASAAVTAMLGTHRLLPTWTEKVSVYVALTESARDTFIAGGLPAERIMVKPNFIDPDPGVIEGDDGYAIFVGRLSAEKGVQGLLRAWERLEGVPLKIVGDGPLVHEAREAASSERMSDIEILGWRPREEVLRLMQRARCLISLQEWPDTFGLAEMEALACGIPIITWGLGETARIVERERAGLICTPGDTDDLTRQIRIAMENPQHMSTLGRNGRKTYKRLYTREASYKRLIEVYEAAAGRDS